MSTKHGGQFSQSSRHQQDVSEFNELTQYFNTRHLNYNRKTATINRSGQIILQTEMSPHTHKIISHQQLLDNIQVVQDMITLIHTNFRVIEIDLSLNS